MTELMPGVLSRCYCGMSAVTWIEHESTYVCVHDRCLSGLPAVLEELEQARAAVSAAATPRGAYARRSATATRSTISRLSIAPLGQGSPFHVPGMVEGAPWTVLVETNFGHISLPCNANEAAARRGNSVYRSRAAAAMEVTYGGVYAVGGVIVSPSGQPVDPWGAPPVHGRPRWRPITRTSDWVSCAGCGRRLWPGCLITVATHRCVSCTAPEEVDDPRVWPDEPGYPGDSALPEHLKKDKAAKR